MFHLLLCSGKQPCLLHFPLSVFPFQLCNDRCWVFLQAVCRKLKLFTCSVYIAESLFFLEILLFSFHVFFRHQKSLFLRMGGSIHCVQQTEGSEHFDYSGSNSGLKKNIFTILYLNAQRCFAGCVTLKLLFSVCQLCDCNAFICSLPNIPFFSVKKSD